ncbi:MAG: polyphosphate kinase 2 [Desulforhopalus sp.]
MGKKQSRKKEKKDNIPAEEALRRKPGKSAGKEKVAIWVDDNQLRYEQILKELQVELMKLQLHMKKSGERILAIFEGRDAAGKGITIKQFIAHLNPRYARVVALPEPNGTEMTQWYFQRYISHLPSASEMVFFDRSWYNRAMIEPVMGFCTDEQNKRFLKDVPMLEEMLVKDGIKLFKFYFSVSREVQKARFALRKEDPLQQYKISSMDELAQDYWDQYSIRKFQMLSETNRTIAPWTIVRSDNLNMATINCMKFLLYNVDYTEKLPNDVLSPDPDFIVSGIDELRHMEENLMQPEELHG